MKKLILCAAVTSSFFGGSAYTEDAPTPDNQVAYNVAVASEYRFRGVSQSRLDPALQGGIDYTNNPTGIYLGAWASSIKWLKDAGGKGNVELDLYGGVRGEVVKDVSYDLGVLTYVYPSNKLGRVAGLTSANTTEVYGQLGWGPLYAKYSYSLTDTFGFVDSKKSGYVDLGANVDLTEGYTLNLHGGHQSFKNNGAFSYTDWKVGVTKEFFGLTFNLAALGTDAKKALYVTPQGDHTAKTRVVLLVSKIF